MGFLARLDEFPRELGLGRAARAARKIAAVLVTGDGERGNFYRSARTRPPPTEMPDSSPSAMKPQFTALIHDFAASLGSDPPSMPEKVIAL